MSEVLLGYILNVDEEIKYCEEELERCGGKDEKIEHCLSLLKEYKAQGKTMFVVDEHPLFNDNDLSLLIRMHTKGFRFSGESR